ncbi:hypothetical protein GCM10009599_01490 [Luteococcus peritonei]
MSTLITGNPPLARTSASSAVRAAPGRSRAVEAADGATEEAVAAGAVARGSVGVVVEQAAVASSAAATTAGAPARMVTGQAYWRAVAACPDGGPQGVRPWQGDRPVP